MVFSFSKSLSSKLIWIMCVGVVSIVILINLVSYFNSKNSTFDLLTEIQVNNMVDTNALYDFYGKTKRLAIESLAEQFSSNLNMPSEQIM
ncbi:hypothetical protein RBO56_000843 [Campylobacter lari]|nr:hypothetical protein [Campylobacter lari]